MKKEKEKERKEKNCRDSPKRLRMPIFSLSQNFRIDSFSIFNL